MSTNQGAPGAQANPANGNGQAPKEQKKTVSMVLGEEFTKWKPMIQSVLPKHMNIERVIKLASKAYLERPDLIKCTIRSMVKATVQCAELGLDPSPLLGECAFVPFENTVKVRDGNTMVERKEQQVQLMPQYVGLIKLAKQSGDVSDVYAVIVDECDKVPEFDENGNFVSGFYEEQGTVREIHHRPRREKYTGTMYAVYGVVKFKDDTKHFEVLMKKDVERIRGFSKAKDAPAWRDHYDAMAKKTAIKQALKTVPKSPDKLAAALHADNSVDAGIAYHAEDPDAKSEVIDTTGEVVSEETAAATSSQPAEPSPPFGNSPADQPQSTEGRAPPAKSRTAALGEQLERTAGGQLFDKGTGEVRS